MSMRQTTAVTCPQCGHSQDFPTWPSLNVSLDPDEKPRLLSGELHRFTCERCSAQTEVSYPLLYHDMDRKLMVHYLDEGNTPEELPDGILGGLLGGMRESYTFRYVHSRNALIEKIHIADAEMDDRVLEIFKLLLRSQTRELAQGELFFQRLDATSDDVGTILFLLLTDHGGQEISLPLSTYHAYAAHFSKLVAADTASDSIWQRVDMHYAAEFIARHKPAAEA